jgi:phosphomethylpyrimidine synthase
MTQLELAKKGKISKEMEIVAKDENISPELLKDKIKEGKVVIPANKNHTSLHPIGIGEGLRTKVNVNLGSSKDMEDFKMELEKLEVSIKYGADAVMDLSTGDHVSEIRKEIIKRSPVMVGTVPIYEAAIRAVQKFGFIGKMPKEFLFEVIEEQCEDGVDFITVHCGVTLSAIEKIKNEGRLTNIVRRGGSFLTEWMIYNNKENPLYEFYDELLKIVKKNDVTLSLGDGLRPGCLSDATDRAQIHELITLGELTEIAWQDNVQVMIEGPGHVPIDEIETNIKLQKSLCHGAPFYVLGPIVTDIAPGYDHITSAIGGAMAAWFGADFLCYVTPAEHLRLPDANDVKEGLIAAKIAAHAGDIGKKLPGSMEKDNKMAHYRRTFNWKEQINISLDPDKAREYRDSLLSKDEEVCSMCGEYCAIKKVKDYFGEKS